MNWTVILQCTITLVLTGIGWVIRRGWLKYERALVAAERARAEAERERRQTVEKELRELKDSVRGVTGAVERVTRDHEAMKKFLGEWAHKFTDDIGNLLKLSQKDVEELKSGIKEMASFFGTAGENPDKTVVKQIGKNSVLVHNPKKRG